MSCMVRRYLPRGADAARSCSIDERAQAVSCCALRELPERRNSQGNKPRQYAPGGWALACLAVRGGVGGAARAVWVLGHLPPEVPDQVLRVPGGQPEEAVLQEVLRGGPLLRAVLHTLRYRVPKLLRRTTRAEQYVQPGTCRGEGTAQHSDCTLCRRVPRHCAEGNALEARLPAVVVAQLIAFAGKALRNRPRTASNLESECPHDACQEGDTCLQDGWGILDTGLS